MAKKSSNALLRVEPRSGGRKVVSTLELSPVSAHAGHALRPQQSLANAARFKPTQRKANILLLKMADATIASVFSSLSSERRPESLELDTASYLPKDFGIAAESVIAHHSSRHFNYPAGPHFDALTTFGFPAVSTFF